MNNMLNQKSILSIYKKELNDFFYSSIAYVFLVLFIVIPNVIWFYFIGGIFTENNATMRSYFSILPYVFIIFIPGLTMGAWSKERNSGTIEILFTLPVSQMEVLLGKFFAALTLVAVALASILPVPLLTHILLGSFDWGQIFAQFFGSLLLAGCYIALTFFLSSLTKELIDSFLLSASILLVLTLIGFYAQKVEFYPWLAWLKTFFNNISLSTHFMNFSKGVIDSRDLIYYLGLTVMFFFLNIYSLDSKRWS
jgi:ABC-2 type transport system permease protein